MLRATLALTLLLALPALAQAPPPLLDEIPADEDPVVESAPDPGAGDEFFEEDPDPKPTPKPDPRPRRDDEPRWSGGMTFLINSLAGVGVFCVAGFVPGGFCMAPAAAGLAQATLGDRYSDRRGAFAPPVIVNYLVTGVGVTGLIMSVFIMSSRISDPVVTAALIGAVAFAVVAPSVASAATYWLLSEPKTPGDTGSGQPGAFTPAHPDITARAPLKPPRPPPVAMRY